MSLQRVPVNDFRGGLNTRDGPFDLQKNESPDLLNVTISALVGTLESRKGKTRVDTSGMPNANVDYAKQVVIGASGKRFLMLSINGGIYAMTPSGEVKKLFAGTAASIWDFEVYADAAGQDWVYCGNGVDAMKKWDGEAAAVVAWPAAKGTIPKGGTLCVWENRMCISYVGEHSQRLFFSEFSDPEATIAEYGFVDIRGSEEDLDSIQDLAVLGARLIVLKRRGVFFISSPVTFLNRHIGGPGVWGRFQTAELENKLYFFNPQGIFATGGVEVTMESGSINNYFPSNLNISKLEQARLITTKDTYPRLLLAVTTGSELTNDKLIEMVPHINFRRIGGRRYLLLPAFMLHTLKASALATWNPTGTEEMIVGTGKSSSLVAFPAIAVTDTMNRADENPLSNGGKWEQYQLESISGPFQIRAKDAVVASNAQVGVMAWGSAAIKGNGPQVSAELSFIGNIPFVGHSHVMGLATCITGTSTTWNGYMLRFYRNNVGVLTYTAFLEKVEGGVIIGLPLIRLEGLPAYQDSDQIGLTVTGGKIYIGYKSLSAGKWEILAVAEDASFKEGKSALVLSSEDFVAPSTELGLGMTNYSQAEWANTAAETAAAFRLFNGITDDGVPIIAHWTSSWMAIQEQEPKERLRRLNIELSGEAEVEVFKDFEEVPAFTAVIPKAEGSEPSKYRFARVRPETHGRFHQVRVKTVSAGTPFSVNAMELAIRGGKEH